MSQYEPLAELEPLLEPLLAAARDTRDQANETLASVDADLTSAHGSLSGCEEEVGKQREEEERVLLESIPKLNLSITYYGPVESEAFSREEARRWAGANDPLLPTTITTPIEVSFPAKAGFTYELLQSSDLVTWQTQTVAAYLIEDKLLSWQITPTTGSRTRDAVVKDREPEAIPYFRLSISPGDATQSGGGRTPWR
ncbi:MAG: hypothetical protein ACI8T1_004709 [Verrucomicrobiales bacterium]